MALSSNHSWPHADTPPQLSSSAPSVAPAPGRDPRHALLIQAAEGLHLHGTAAYRLEEAIARLSQALGVRARVFATPTSVQLALDSHAGTHTELIRAGRVDADLGRLAELDRTLALAERGALSVNGARRAIARLCAEARRPDATTAAASALVSGTAAVFFGGGATDVAVSALFGAALVLLARLTTGARDAARVHEPLAAFLASFVAWILAARVSSLTPEVITLSALITLVPGLTVTTAVSELASGHVVSGTSRLAGAATLFMSLAFGVALGHAIAVLLAGSAGPRLGTPLGSSVEVTALLLAPLSFAVLFRAAPRDVPWICLAGVLSFAGARGAATVIGPELGSFFGALLLGVFSNGYARWSDRASSIVRVPGLLLLVPGSIGFRSVSSFVADDALAGTAGLFRVALVAMGLVAGLFTANVLLPPRRSL